MTVIVYILYIDTEYWLLLFYHFSKSFKLATNVPTFFVFFNLGVVFKAKYIQISSFAIFHKIFRDLEKLFFRKNVVFLQGNWLKKWNKNWVSFADLPLSRPPCLSAVPYGGKKHYIFHEYDIFKGNKTTVWESGKTGYPWTANETRSILPL